MSTSTLTVSYRTRTGWLRFVLSVANWLSRHPRLQVLAGVWLYLLQPTFFIGIHITGQRRRLWRIRLWRRWSYRRLPIRVALQIHRGHHSSIPEDAA